MSIRPSLALLGERMNTQKMRFYSVRVLQQSLLDWKGGYSKCDEKLWK